jgi:hypothetical protein
LQNLLETTDGISELNLKKEDPLKKRGQQIFLKNLRTPGATQKPGLEMPAWRQRFI